MASPQRQRARGQGTSSDSEPRERRRGGGVPMRIWEEQGSLEEMAEERATSLEFDLEEIPQMVDRAGSKGVDLRDYQHAHAVYLLPLRGLLPSLGRTKDLKQAGAPERPAEIPAEQRRTLGRIKSQDGAEGQQTIAAQENWINSGQEAEGTVKASMAQARLLRSAVMDLESAEMAARRLMNSRAIQDKEDKLQEIRDLADALVKMVNVGKQALDFTTNPWGTTAAVFKEATDVSARDIFIELMGDAQEYDQLQRDIANLTEENEALLEASINTNIKAATEAIDGWEGMASANEESREAKRRATLQGAAGTARAAGGTEDDAQMFFMAQAYFDVAFFGQKTQEELDNLAPHWDSVFQWLSRDWDAIHAGVPGQLGPGDVHLPSGSMEAMQAQELARHLGQVRREAEVVGQNVDEWEAIALEWRQELASLTGLYFREPTGRERG